MTLGHRCFVLTLYLFPLDMCKITIHIAYYNSSSLLSWSEKMLSKWVANVMTPCHVLSLLESVP